MDRGLAASAEVSLESSSRIQTTMTTTSIRFTNSRAVSLLVFLEPWAEELAIEPGDSLLITQDAVDDGRIHLDVVDEGYLLHGDVHSKLRIHRRGELLWESYEPPPA